MEKDNIEKSSIPRLKPNPQTLEIYKKCLTAGFNVFETKDDSELLYYSYKPIDKF